MTEKGRINELEIRLKKEIKGTLTFDIFGELFAPASVELRATPTPWEANQAAFGIGVGVQAVEPGRGDVLLDHRHPAAVVVVTVQRVLF